MAFCISPPHIVGTVDIGPELWGGAGETFKDQFGSCDLSRAHR